MKTPRTIRKQRQVLGGAALAITLCVGQFAQGALTTHYTFDNAQVIGSVGAADVIGGNNLTPTGTFGGTNITTGQPGVLGQSYLFVRDAAPTAAPGLNDPTQFENLLRSAVPATPTGAGEVTISLWFNQTASSGQNKLFGYGSANLDADATTGEAMDLSLEAGGIRLRNFNGNTTYGSGFNFLPGGANEGWHQLALRVNSGAITFNDVNIFLDGVQLSVAADGGALNDTLNIPSSLFSAGNIGYDNTLNNGFTGYLDELRIYDTALSDTEILALVPEPSSLALLLLGAAGVWARARNRRGL